MKPVIIDNIAPIRISSILQNPIVPLPVVNNRYVIKQRIVVTTNANILSSQEYNWLSEGN
jgi:hypothetical protein